MAPSPSSLFLILAICVVTSGEVLSFEPDMLGSPDPDADMLVLVSKHGTSPGKEVLHAALKSLDAGLERSRGLVVSECMGCASLDQLLAKHNLKGDDLPVAFIFPFKSDQTKSGIFSKSLKGVDQPLPAMSSFIESFDAGELQPWVRSLPTPTAQEQQGPVRVIVGSTFEQEIVEGEKHTLLLLFSGAGRAAKPLLPILEQIGQKLEAEKSPLRAAKFDNDANDFPPSFNVPINSIPQLMLFRQSDGGDPDIFPPDSPQTEEGVIDWLREMLPDRNYGLDALFSSMAKKGKRKRAGRTELEEI